MRRNLILRSFLLQVSILFLCFIPAFAQTETWIPAEPARVVPGQVAVFSCAGQATVSSRWVFGGSGFRVEQTPIVSRSGQTISLDVRVEEWTGVSTTSLAPFTKNFDIGVLEPGTYTLNFKSWNTTLKQIEFTIFANPPAPQTIEGICFFVTQHYRDFLARDPDGNGFAFWTNQIAKCGMDASCLEVARINVSASFLQSIEFNETGYYVYRMYKGALGRPPTYAEFVSEAAQIGRNVVVGDLFAWRTILEGQKDFYTRDFFNRSDFQARYGGLTTAQFVDQLFQTEGITPTQLERNDLINSIDHCPFQICPTRITLLRRIIENSAFNRRVFNEGFVTLQYFGYLRRDPDPPGFQFWLDKLNRFNGNIIDAEMVKAFINSDEYRKRFP